MKRLQRRRYQIFLVIGLILAVLTLMYTQRIVFNPFLLALALAYILNPVVRWMERHKVPRKSAVVLIFSLLTVLTLAVAVTLIPMAAGQAQGWYVAFLGEPFPDDHNRNGRFDPLAERDTWQDLNHNSRYDGPDSFEDINDNGQWDKADPGDSWEDVNGNERWDEGEAFVDHNRNGLFDPPRLAEPYVDANGNGRYDVTGEPFKDFNGNGQLDLDIPGDGRWVDLNANGVYDKGYIGRLADRIVHPDDGDGDGEMAFIGRYIPRKRWAPLVKSGMAGLRENLNSVVASAKDMVGAAFSKGWAAAGQIGQFLLLLLLTPIYMCFLLYSMDSGWRKAIELVPASILGRFLDITTKIDSVIGAFFRGRLLVCSAIAIFTATGFVLCGVKFGLLFGIMIGVTSFIPFLNSIPFGLALLVCWLDEMGLGAFGAVVAVFFLGQGLDPLLMTLVMGKELQLHPVTILLSMFVCASLLGFFGMLLAVPIVAIGKILFVEFILPHLKELAEGPLPPTEAGAEESAG